MNITSGILILLLSSLITFNVQGQSRKDFILKYKHIAIQEMERTGIPADTKVHDIRKEQRRRLLESLKDFTVSLSGTRPVEEAVVTSGGVAVSEVDPKTMESKQVKGLFIAGELLDVDGICGGYNLQFAWSSGAIAGMHAGVWGRGVKT